MPFLTAQIAGYSCAACLGLFLYLIDRVVRRLRPSGVLQSVAAQAHQIIETVYPQRLPRDSGTKAPAFTDGLSKEPTGIVTNPTGGVVLAFDLEGLVALAVRYDCVIEVIPQVGDFVASGKPLFRLYGGAELPSGSLRRSIALGPERTLDQDPAFAFRVIVDIACKALSPAVNDPSTAMLAIDQIHDLLRHVGKRRLDAKMVCGQAGRVRLLYRTPGWEDFVTLAVTEMRHFGSESIQFARRLRAMLEDLIQTLPEAHAVLLRQELEPLTAERCFAEPADRALAEVSDWPASKG